MDEQQLTIGRLAKLAGISPDTVRFYERKGLIAAPARSDSGYRLYTVDDLSRIQMIKGGRELGFSLLQIQEILGTIFEPKPDCKLLKSLADQRLKEIKIQLKELEAARKRLEIILNGCTAPAECAFKALLDRDP